MKKIIITCVLFVTSFLSAQSVNNYAAVIVPLKFDFQQTKNEFRISTITKYYLEKAGFKAMFANDDYVKEHTNRCDLLEVDVVKLPGFLNTKLQILLKDCFGKLIYKSESGTSKEKEYKLAYEEALALAFESVNKLEYTYKGSIKTTRELEYETVSQKKEVDKTAPKAIQDLNLNTLYAQPTSTGYQLIDSTPKVVMKLIKTDNPNSFKAFKGDVEGELTFRDGRWVFDTFKKDHLSEVLVIKF